MIHLSICIPILKYSSRSSLCISSALLYQSKLRLSSVSVEIIVLFADSVASAFLCQYEHSGINYFSSPRNGIYDAFNILICNSRGNFVLVLGDDDFLLPHKSTIPLGRLLTSDSQALIIHGPILFGFSLSSSRLRPSHASRFLNLDSMRINHPGMIVSRSIYNEYGLFSSSYSTAGDYEWVMRVINVAKFSKLADPYAFHRLGGASSNLSKSALMSHLHCLNAVRLHFPSLFIFALLARALRYCLMCMRKSILSLHSFRTFRSFYGLY